jgi:hypothetical protein
MISQILIPCIPVCYNKETCVGSLVSLSLFLLLHLHHQMSEMKQELEDVTKVSNFMISVVHIALLG